MMPEQKPGKSRQDYATPSEFILAVQTRFGHMDVDLAASSENAKAPVYVTEEQNSLATDWQQWTGNLWLNPPFANIERWVQKCAFTTLLNGARIFVLVPASIGTYWFSEFVHQKAMVLGLSPRLTFEGEKDPYPKDLMLCVYGTFRGFDVWNWRRQ